MPGGALAVRQTENIPEYRGKIDLAEAFKLKFKNHFTYQMLSDRYGVSVPAVHGALKQFLNLMQNPEQSAVYEEKRAEILNAVEFRIVKQMVNKKKLKAASLNNLAYAASQINNMIRLEKGQPTAITEHLDTDLGAMIDQLCGIKSAGSGSTVDITPVSDDTMIQASELPIPTQVPTADRSTTGNLEGTNQAAKLTKSGNPHKPRTTKPSKSASSNRKQNTCNITASLNSKDSATKHGTNTIPATDTTSAAGKEWYE